MTISPIWGHAPAEGTETKFGIRGRVAIVIMHFKFYRNRLSGFRAVRGQKWWFPIDFDCRPLAMTVLPVIISIINVKKTSQFITQCKSDISHTFKTAKIIVFDPMMCKSPDMPLGLQDELLC